jgi:hypothetical protein
VSDLVEGIIDRKMRSKYRPDIEGFHPRIHGFRRKLV